MAFASSIQKGQIPVGCHLCKDGNKIQWKCITCESLMCDKCKDEIHLKIGKDHKILNINDIGKPDGSKNKIIFSEVKCVEHSNRACCLFCNTCNKFICPKCITNVHNGHELIEEENFNKSKVELKQNQKSVKKLEYSKYYRTDLTYIHCIAVSANGSMWMADNLKFKLQHVKLRENKTTEVISSLNTKIYGMAKTHSNNILVATDKTKLQLINIVTGEITDSKYDINPLLPTCIHVTSDHRVVMGAKSRGGAFPAKGRRVLMVLDQEGKILQEYEQENHKKQLATRTKLFTYPECVTSTSNGNLCVVDTIDKDNRGRVVVLSQRGDILGIYTGRPGVNTGKATFRPVGILTTPLDNIIVTDMDNHLLHILTDQGQIITYFFNIGFSFPCSLVLSTPGTIYVGCVSAEGSEDYIKARLHELKYSGF